MQDNDRKLFTYDVSDEQMVKYFPEEFKVALEASGRGDHEQGRIIITTNTKAGRKTIEGIRFNFWRVSERGTMGVILGTSSPRMAFVKPLLPKSPLKAEAVRQALTAFIELNAAPFAEDHPFRLAALAYLQALTVTV